MEASVLPLANLLELNTRLFLSCLDGIDEENPGDSSKNRERKDIQFVIVCQHDHKDLAEYVFIEDEGPPRLSQPGDDFPDYARFVKWEFGGPGGGKK